MKNENANEFNWDITKTPVYGPNGEVITGYHEIKRDDNDKHIIIKPNTFHPMTTQQFSEVANKVAAQVGGTNLKFTDWDTTDRDINIGRAKPVITCQMEISEPLEIAGSKIQGKLTIGVGFDNVKYASNKATIAKASCSANVLRSSIVASSTVVLSNFSILGIMRFKVRAVLSSGLTMSNKRRITSRHA